jgi:hypothetical protein
VITNFPNALQQFDLFHQFMPNAAFLLGDDHLVKEFIEGEVKMGTDIGHFEIPPEAFNPVKTVFDLLRPAHQA